jgi:hypothetical protein
LATRHIFCLRHGLLADTPVVSAYENASTTEITAGITLGVDHDTVAGLNLLTLVLTAANGYEKGKDYSLVVTTGTVDSVSAVGEVVASFTIGRSAGNRNTVWGTVSGTPTTTTMVSDITLTDDNQFKGRVIIFETASDAGLVQQGAVITGGAAATDTLTFESLTTAPSSTDTFRIV